MHKSYVVIPLCVNDGGCVFVCCVTARWLAYARIMGRLRSGHLYCNDVITKKMESGAGAGAGASKLSAYIITCVLSPNRYSFLNA